MLLQSIKAGIIPSPPINPVGNSLLGDFFLRMTLDLKTAALEAGRISRRGASCRLRIHQPRQDSELGPSKRQLLSKEVRPSYDVMLEAGKWQRYTDWSLAQRLGHLLMPSTAGMPTLIEISRCYLCCADK